jgi:hypothetical protein
MKLPTTDNADMSGVSVDRYEPEGAAAPALVIVAGPFAHAAARAQAVRIARRETGETLRLAVFDIDDEAAAPDQAQLAELHAAFDAVAVVARARRAQMVRGLVRTILRLEGQDQWIACDWHDVCHIMRNAGEAGVRWGCGHGVGGERAALATLDAVTQAERQGAGLRTARGVCIGIRDASGTIRGSEIKEVVHQVRASVGPGATITMSIGSDSALEDGALEVDIFAFGEFGEAEPGVAADAGGSSDPVWHGEDAGGDPLYAAARSLVLQSRRASISLVQRHLRIGYGRASRLLDAMEGDVLSARGEYGQRLVLYKSN